VQCRHYCHQKLSIFYYGQVKAKSHEWDAFCKISRDYNSHSPLKEFLAKHAFTFCPTVPAISSIPLFLTQNSRLPVVLKSENSPFTTSLRCYSFSVSWTPSQQLERRNFTRCPARRWLLMPSHAFSLAIASIINGITGHGKAKQYSMKHVTIWEAMV